jgi:MFS family permease
LGVIFAANFFSYLDRQLVSALEKPLRTDLALDSVEYNLLWTLFTIGYMVCSPFIGFASDRWRRPRLFAACIFIWSIATIASGLATAKPVLYVARILIGLGEAGCLVIGSSLISDFFGPETRGRALSIFSLGLPLGGTAAFILAGLLIKWHVSWRYLFFIAGAPGFLLMGLLWTLAEPMRGASDTGGHGHGDGHEHGHGADKGGFKEYVHLLKTPTLIFVILAQAFAVIILIPLVHDGVQFFVDTRGMSPEGARITLGMIALIAGGIGNTLSGLIGDRLRRRTKGAYALMAGVSFLVGYPCLLIGFTSSHRWVFLPALTLGALCIFLCMPAVNTQIANATRPTQRAMAWAMAVFILHLLGDTLSPPLFGIADRHVGRLKAFLVFSTALIPASICCFLAARTAARDESKAGSAAPAPGPIEI